MREIIEAIITALKTPQELVADTAKQNEVARKALSRVDLKEGPFRTHMQSLHEMVRTQSQQAASYAANIGSQLRGLIDEKDRDNYLWLDTQILGYANDTKDPIKPGYDVNKNNLKSNNA